METVELEYTSSACNRFPQCLDWGECGLIAYAACNAIVLFQPENNCQGRVVQTLVCHKKLVTSVQWINNSDLNYELLSTSADHLAIIWTKHLSSWTFTPQILKGHSSVVKCASAHYLSNTSLLIATSSADSSVKIWKREVDNDVTCVQTISLGYGLALALKLNILNESTELVIPLLAIGCDDSKIYLYSTDKEGLFVSLTYLPGHDDWIHSLDFIKDNNKLLLVSGSQDNYIRIWKFTSQNEETQNPSDDLKVKENVFQVLDGNSYIVTLESVLSGHENWIYSVQWKQCSTEGSTLQILSASMDKTIIIWEIDSSSNLWTEKARFGEVGGNTLGFYGAVFSPDGNSIMAHGYQGAIHSWNYDKELNVWEPDVAFSGHFDSVQDICWDPEGAYLLSCSYDQTTRLHAPIYGENDKILWYELSRPQIHGYDMVCLAVIDRYQFVSAGDEKILRVFKAPESFAENLKNLCRIDTSIYLKDTLPKGASVPALGLSNKAVFQDDLEQSKDNERKHFKDIYPEFTFSPVTLTNPPTEEILLQNTLWPEVQKLYGHPYEVFSIACNNQKTIIASACKANKVEHAAIILWSTKTWKQLGHLAFHSLTITQLEFSPDDQYLLSVSRDRLWAIYEAVVDQVPPYRKVAHYDKKLGIHNRIIWSCSWSHDNNYFATASRDKKVAVWNRNASFALASKPFEAEDSTTAVTFAPVIENNRYILAIGYENGRILLTSWSYATEHESWKQLYIIDHNFAHHLAVTRLKFSPSHEKNEKLILSSCGSDHFVRIYSFKINSIALNT